MGGVLSRDGNGVGLFGAPPHPAPSLIGRVWEHGYRVYDGFGFNIQNPCRVRVGFGNYNIYPAPAPNRKIFIYPLYINIIFSSFRFSLSF